MAKEIKAIRGIIPVLPTPFTKDDEINYEVYGQLLDYVIENGVLAKEIDYKVPPNDYQRMAALYELLKEGYAKQIVLATDVWQKAYLRTYGGYGYCRVLDFVVPTLRDAGISEEDIKLITGRNAAGLLSIQ